MFNTQPHWDDPRQKAILQIVGPIMASIISQNPPVSDDLTYMVKNDLLLDIYEKFASIAVYAAAAVVDKVADM